MPLSLVWLDGRLLPLEEARISPLDRGFIFGDGAYEVLPVFDGRAYRFEAHMARLDRSLAEMRMAPPLDRAGWLKAFGKLVHGNGGGDLLLYVQVTRGVEGERNHVPLAGTRPTVFASVQKLPATPAAVIEQGVAAITAEDIRWSRCDIKSTSLLGNVLLRWLAADSGATESVLLRDGVLTEGSTSSAHVVKGGRIATPPQTNAILPGTTRGVIFELAGREGIASERRPVTEAEVRGADELIIASAGAGIRAVTKLDGKPVGAGTPGPVFRRIYAAYKATQREFSTELPA
ncbi:MAG TPA: D-amino acid aminotransferase [Steroidobacteraceae bacterium]|jgi:D-alanine transaminase|nr:D-amino acid aminotransferase [Steroidobacteraceae bacterium]